MDRPKREAAWVKDLSAKLRETSTLFGAPSTAPAPPAAPTQPARKQQPDLPPLSAAFEPIESSLRAEAAERARAADPYEQRRDRLARLAPQTRSDEVIDVEECINLARDEAAEGHVGLSRGYLDEVDAYLNAVDGSAS